MDQSMQGLLTAQDAGSGPVGSRYMPIHSEVEVKPEKRDYMRRNKIYAIIKFTRRNWQNRGSGWQFGTKIATAMTGVVTICNLIVTFWTIGNRGNIHYLATIPLNSCRDVHIYSTWSHVFINLFSSITLAASNYCMQCLVSPTRAEVDTAHGKGRWLDIGVLGIRNFRDIHPCRVILWWMLCLSSIPQHFLYNSAVIRTDKIGTGYYDSLITLEWFLWDGLDTTALQIPNVQPYENEIRALYEAIDWPHQGYLNKTEWLNQSFPDCQKYFQSKQPDTAAAVVQVFTNSTTFKILQSTSNNTGNPYIYTANYDTAHPVDISLGIGYCLIQLDTTYCTIQLSVIIMIIVSLMDVLKVSSMIFMLMSREHAPLITIGDAVASFLEYPDTSTEAKCLMTRPERIWMRYDRTVVPRTFEDRRSRRWKACSWRYRAGILSTHIVIWLAVAWLIPATLLVLAHREGVRVTDIFDGFGTLNVNTVLIPDVIQDGRAGLLLAAVLANLPQAVLSILNVTYNALMTRMVLSHEWSLYATIRRGLRTSTPQGAQRSTYWLQLPFRYSLPMLIAWTILHFILSQSFFMFRMIYTGPGDAKPVTILYISGMALVTFVSGYGLMLLAVIWFGFHRLPSSMPIAGSCSMAISAACHPPRDDEDASLKPVQWGVVDQDCEPGHCTFTSRLVSPPVHKKEYI